MSIHAPAWGATGSSWMLLAFWIFQSTRPHGGATEHEPPVCGGRIISIHAPAWGRDLRQQPATRASDNFNPRARMGARRYYVINYCSPFIFQSTRPHGGATGDSLADAIAMGISIHAPAWGRDEVFAVDDAEPGTFQSTRPHGGATFNPLLLIRPQGISIHAPSWGATCLRRVGGAG